MRGIRDIGDYTEDQNKCRHVLTNFSSLVPYEMYGQKFAEYACWYYSFIGFNNASVPQLQVLLLLILNLLIMSPLNKT